MTVDGGSIGAQSSYTFTQAIADHTIAASSAVDNRPPDVSGAAPSIASIWPPNHKMVPITSITNNETGVADASGVGTSTAQVKATRNGKGTGRTYTILVEASDASNNKATREFTVVVPHDMSGHPGCVRAEGVDVPDTTCAR